MRCHGNGKQRKTNFQVQEMQVVRTICSSTANTSTVTLIFLHYFNNNDATIRCQFYDQRRRKLYHTLLGHGGQGREMSSQMDQRPLQRVWVGYFLSHRTLKIPSSINKPVQSCKIQGKWSEKKCEISKHGWLVNIFYSISFMDYHFNLCLFFPRANRRILDRVRLMLWISHRNFSFHYAIRFRPVRERISKRSLPHRKRLDNMEAEFHFPFETFPPVVNC